MRARNIIISIGAGLALVAGGSAAGAAITASPVSGSGVINGCYTTQAVNGTHVFVLQDAGTACPKGTTAISWNQTGPQGPQGLQGPAGTAGANGANGTNGTSVISTALSPGNANCPDGGAAFTSASPTTYACNGTGATVTSLAPGGATCPNGGAQVTDGFGNNAYACTGSTGLAGPSTAGPSGLNVTEVTTGNSGGGAPTIAVAACPADHPYVLGGGYEEAGGSSDGEVYVNEPQYNFGQAPDGWVVYSTGDSIPMNSLFAYAICAK